MWKNKTEEKKNNELKSIFQFISVLIIKDIDNVKSKTFRKEENISRKWDISRKWKQFWEDTKKKPYKIYIFDN